MHLKEQIIIFYQTFYIDYLNRNNYLFVPTINENKAIEKFIEYLQEKYTGSCDYNFLYTYFSYQFSHYSNKEAIKSRNFLKIGHIVNENAVKRFENSFESQKQKGIEYAKKQNIFLNDFVEIIDFDKNENKIKVFNKVNEIERNRFLNKEFGYSHCLSLGIEFDESSNCCINCNFNKDCK